MPPYRAGICSCTAAPYRFVELLCRKNLLLVFCKETQQREFGPGKACVGIIEICMAVRKIQPQAADGDLTGGLKFFFYFFFHSFLAFQKHLDHGQKFIEIIRFGEIIVASLLNSKKALMRPIGSHNDNANAAKMEKLLEDGINAIGLGPQGMGGKYSVMGVNIENTARHPSTIGVAVNVGCWSHRRGHLVVNPDLTVTCDTHSTWKFNA